MEIKLHSLLKKASFLLGALFLGWAAQAQSTNNTPADSTHHRSGVHQDRSGLHQDRYGMHHAWGHRPGGDSLAKTNGFHRGGPGAWASRSHIHYSPEQRKQLMAINKDYRQKSEDLFKQDNLTLKQYKAGLLTLQKEKKAKLAALLTQEQKDQLASRKKRMDENRQVMEVAHLERLKLRLNLTDDQVAKIKAGQENLHSQVKAIHENEDLLPQQKREQMKALLAKRNDTYKAVLTPDQYSQFEKMHERGGRDGFDHGGFGPGSHRTTSAPQGPGGTDAI